MNAYILGRTYKRSNTFGFVIFNEVAGTCFMFQCSLQLNKEVLLITSFFQVRIVKHDNVGQLVLCIGCLVFEMWPLHSKVKQMNISLQGRSLSRLNDWRSTAYVTREKSVIFTRRSSYNILQIKTNQT